MTPPKMRPGAIFSLATVGVAALVIPPVVFAPLHASAAPNHDFNDVVSTVEQHYSVHPQHIPMMGFISFCAHVWTVGGVKGIRIAEFDNLPQTGNTLSAEQLDQLITNALGSEWEHMITERDANGSVSLIFVRPDGNAMRMLIADYENGELNLVRVEVNADRMEHWIRDPQDTARSHKHNESASLE
jgi:hypothetical protein